MLDVVAAYALFLKLTFLQSSLCDIVNCGPAWQKMQDASKQSCIIAFLSLCITVTDTNNFIATGLFKSLNIPEKVSSELESRLLAAGFVDTVLQITALPFNHDGKRGKLLWYCISIGYFIDLLLINTIIILLGVT